MARSFTKRLTQLQRKDQTENNNSQNQLVKEIASDFIEKSSEKSADRDHRQKINFNIGTL